MLRVYGFELGLGLWVRFESLEVRRGHSSFVQVGKGVPQTMFRGRVPQTGTGWCACKFCAAICVGIWVSAHEFAFSEFSCLCACVRVCIRFFLWNSIRCLSARICTCVSICVGVSLKFATVVNSLFWNICLRKFVSWHFHLLGNPFVQRKNWRGLF